MSPDDIDSVGAASQAISQAMRFAPVPGRDPRRDRAALRRVGRAGRQRRAAGRGPLERARRGQPGRDLRRPAGDLPLGARRRSRLRRRARLLGEPLQPAGDHVPRPARAGGGGAGDGRRRPADGRRRGLGRDVHVQPGERRPEHGRGQRELGARPRGRRRRGDARRLPRQQGDARGRARARPRARTSSTCPTPAAAAPSASTCRRSGARSRASTGRRSTRSSSSAGASSATSAPTRTSSGRSRGGRSFRASLFVLQSRPVTALPRRETPPARDSALALVMGMFGAEETEG